MIMNAKGESKANHKRCEITNIIDNILGRGGDQGRSQSIDPNFWFDHYTTCNKLCVVGES